MLAANVVDVGYPQQGAQLLRRNFHRPWPRRRSRLRLRKRSRTCGVKSYVTFDFLQGLVNVAVEHRDRTKLLQIGESLSAVLGSPSPVLINRPQRNVSENDDWRAVRKMLDIFLHPLQLLRPQRSQPTGLQIDDIHQSDEMHAFLIEAVPARSLRIFSKPIKVTLAVVVNHVVFAWDVEHILSRTSREHLRDGVELLGFRKVGYVAGVDQELGLGLQGFDSIQRHLKSCRNVRIRGLVEAHMAVAQLHKAQLAVHFLRIPERNGTENSALHDIQSPGSGPSHAFQEAPAINTVVVVVVNDLVMVNLVHGNLLILCSTNETGAGDFYSLRKNAATPTNG